VVDLAGARDPWPGFEAQAVTREMRAAVEA
jgi:hypothetical protein